MKLSIITINYNNRVGLQNTIDSVRRQTWKDYEWIVIDGGSTDGSRELIEQYQQHFAYWCSEPDRGVYHAMNKGIAKSNGEYLIFMNSGDIFYDQDVLNRIGNLHSNADIITGQVERMDNHELLRQYNKNLWIQLYVDTLNHQGTFIHRSLFKRHLYDEHLKVVSDWKFWIETIMIENVKVDILPWRVAIQDMNGLSSQMDAVQFYQQERQQVIDNLLPSPLKQILDEYQQMKKSPYLSFGRYLNEHSRFLYAVGYRFLRCLTKIV
jgi:glycosyltransferase involved in cell wall biosynthesis